MAENQEGFSYESPESQKKSATKLLSLELGILGVVVLFILGVLIYLNIIPLGTISNFMSRTPDSVPPQPGQGPIGGVPGLTNANEEITERPLSQLPIRTSSDIEGRGLTIVDDERLRQHMDEFNLSNKADVFTGNDSPIVRTKFNSLEINLTNVEQRTNRFAGEGAEILHSSSVDTEGTNLSINIYLSPSALAGNNGSIYAEQALITTLFRWGYNPQGGLINEDKEEELTQLLESLEANSSRIIEVQ